MKIGILTHYNVSSHGALLQMYGMKRVLEELGHEVYILIFQRNMDFIDSDKQKRFSASRSNLSYYLKNYLIKNGPGMLLYQVKKQKIMDNFRNQNFSLMPYVKAGELDAVLIGADEVFALENGVNFVMFGHGLNCSNIISYAPSYGQTDISRIDKYACRDLMVSGLKRFSAISVRDENSQSVVKSLLGKEVPIVCDPALLYDFRKEIPRGKHDGKYIVVYSYQSNFKEADRIAAIKSYSKKNGCRLYSVGVYYDWCDKHINCSPLEMLEVFGNAKAVITDTFHGTISSYITQSPVAVFVRNNNNNKLDYLLECLCLQDRKVSDLSQLEEILNTKIDYSIPDNNVLELRRFGMEYLLNALKN